VPISCLGADQSRTLRSYACAEDSFAQGSNGSAGASVLFAIHSLEEFAGRHLERGSKSRQVAQTDLACTSFEVRYMNLMNTRLFGEVDLPPTPFLSELPDSFAKLDANIRRHSSSIDLVEALYLVDALSRKIRVEDGSMVPVLRNAPVCRGAPTTRRQWLGRQPKPKILRILQPGKGIRPRAVVC
jgi:hypothetical protein